MYVLVNCSRPLEVIGPFKTLKAAQDFRRADKDNFNGFAAISIRSPEMAKMVAKQLSAAK